MALFWKGQDRGSGWRPEGRRGRDASVQISVHLDYVLGALPLRERFPAARRLGFNAVELPFPYALPAGEYAGLLQDHGLSQISIGAPACDYKAGAPGFSLTPALQATFDRSIDTAIGYARAIGCRNVHVFAGPRAPDVSPELAMETYCRNLAMADDRLRREGLRAVVEAINATDFPGYFINRLDVALGALDKGGCDGVGIVLDVYHACFNGEDPVAFLTDHPDRVAHIQLADYPGRHEPGSGAFDFESLFDAVRRVGYSGSLGLEYVPTRSVFEGVPLLDALTAFRRTT